jgi:polyisoprenoid-binding protein YceI
MSQLRFAAIFVGIILLNACQTSQEYFIPTTTSPTPLTTLPSVQATRYSIRSDLSDVRFLVFRAGTLAALGHNHVIQAKTILGEIYLANDFTRSSVSMDIPVTAFQIDAVQARSEEGEEFSKLPDAEAIAGTTKNMLGNKVLDAAVYPQISIRSLKLTGPRWAPDITVRIKLRDVERDITLPVTIIEQGDQLTVTSVFEINQTDFKMTPFSILGGALQVANNVKVRMRIVAQKA